MSHEPLRDLLPALEIAAFQRRGDGAFLTLAEPPPWFRHLAADASFPFLGHILEEATQFWGSSEPGRREWGPCAEVDGTGHEFHYRVIALAAGGSQYLVFQLDTATVQMREILQRVRDQALAAEQRKG